MYKALYIKGNVHKAKNRPITRHYSWPRGVSLEFVTAVVDDFSLAFEMKEFICVGL